MELYSPTLKYIWLAIKEFTPPLLALRDSVSGGTKKELEDLLEMYSDIANKIDKFNLNFDDPNRFYPGEPVDVEINIPKGVLENLTRLVVRLLEKWRSDLSDLKQKPYLTDSNKERLYKLQELIWPLEATVKAPSTVFGKYSAEGPLVFPGEIPVKLVRAEATNQEYIPLFPRALVELTPGDIKMLCEEFDFNYEHKKPNAAMLLLRKILPLAVVRKFQQMGREGEIKSHGEFLQTKELLGKAKGVMSSARIYNEIMNFKFLIDSSQHIFSTSSYMEDIPRPASAIRLMLEDFFKVS